ncbi:hypothetical protein BJ138DRAFT_1062404 [Hygrophoropsis aurantiaca]|uniref:Uncharacterized protein n=1 Tax=Hygrophoropsis aurantiaca TaxID=72124 RepID=A0ACB8AE42_9AGAM|nr:hypothetical protein BJ138DRAFT_1062404 [Hygrophoropsis aurantiaca]
MDSPSDLLHHHHKKTLHSKRSFGKHPHPIDSPTYDAHDNDPLTDDAASAMSPASSNHPTRASRTTNQTTSHKSTSRARHQLASSLLSDADDGSGADSQTYDGDVESSVTAGAQNHHHHHLGNTGSSGGKAYPSLHHSSSASTLTSQVDPDDLISVNFTSPSNPGVHRISAPGVTSVSEEPPPTLGAAAAFNPAALTPEDIRAFVQMAIDGESWRKYKINEPPKNRPIRIYADGVYDLFHFGHALQLRQAKLSFPNVHLLVGVNTDEDVRSHKARCVMTHAERCEAARHCRWVDEVISDCPWVLDAAFIERWKIDYVAHDEEPYASEDMDDVYSFVKGLGKFIPTRRTPGVSTSELLERIVSGYRRRDFDKKLEKMGHAELKAEGSDFEDRGPSHGGSEVGSTWGSQVGSRVVSRSVSPQPLRRETLKP